MASLYKNKNTKLVLEFDGEDLLYLAALQIMLEEDKKLVVEISEDLDIHLVSSQTSSRVSPGTMVN